MVFRSYGQVFYTARKLYAWTRGEYTIIKDIILAGYAKVSENLAILFIYICIDVVGFEYICIGFCTGVYLRVHIDILIGVHIYIGLSFCIGICVSIFIGVAVGIAVDQMVIATLSSNLGTWGDFSILQFK